MNNNARSKQSTLSSNVGYSVYICLQTLAKKTKVFATNNLFHFVCLNLLCYKYARLFLNQRQNTYKNNTGKKEFRKVENGL